MAHMIMETDQMFSVREKPWHYELTKEHTKIIQEAPNSREALVAAGLDWNVVSMPVYQENGLLIPGYKANVRDKDNMVLGIVSGRYKIVQNTEAFEFTDSLIGETENGEVRYETAGSLYNGKKVWLLAKLPTTKVLDDDVEPYLCFANSFDGSGAVQVCITGIRVVCQNTLNIALNTAKRKWSTKHIGDMQSKLEEAKLCLRMADSYMANLDVEADRLANAKLYREQIEEILDEMFPVDGNASERKKNNIVQFKNQFWTAYGMPDIQKFDESAWKAVNAMSDVITHSAPRRNTASYNENRWGKIMDGHMLFDQFNNLINKKIAA
jgi:phage/plasmid-like protein (TIGR03299 family)